VLMFVYLSFTYKIPIKEESYANLGLHITK
jgi:hypothetical protein